MSEKKSPSPTAKMDDPKILNESTEWLIVNKPSGYHSVSQNKENQEHTVQHWLLNSRPELKSLPEAGLVHRLDQKTSGCLFVAKNEKTFQDFQKRFRTGKGIQKIYLAIAEGKLNDGRFELYFSSRYKSSKKMTVRAEGPIKERGHCAWKILKHKNNFNLIEIQLLSAGKRHQIRAGFSFLGMPLLGDELYGGSRWAEHPEGIGLHAFKLIFENQEIEAPQPAAWLSLF